MTKKATLSFDSGDSIQLNVIPGTLGPSVVDVAPLLGNSYFTYDPGFVATASTKSAITFIDGSKGILLHRGYPIEQLARKRDYMALSHLLFNGELPTNDEYEEFVKTVRGHTMVTERMKTFLNGFRADSHPMAIMCGLVSALSAFYHDDMNIRDEESRRLVSYRLLAKMPTLAAMSYKYSIGHPVNYPDNSKSFIENFLYMMFATPCGPIDINPDHIRALDIIFMLHADHEQNASTSTVRLAGSSGANPFACIAAGIAALWGPSHGGANEAVINMLNEIDKPENIAMFIDKAKNKDDPFRLMGFGHRVYKNFDPRAKIMKEVCDLVLSSHNNAEEEKLFVIAKQLEQIALKDEYFIEKNLYPNVDFYSGIVFRALGIPVNMFTVIFAIARSIGWISHWNEMVGDEYRIGRPRQLYVGKTMRNVPD